MSEKYETVKKWYDKGAWDITMCKNAVVKNWITPEEFTEITGIAYEEEDNENRN